MSNVSQLFKITLQGLTEHDCTLVRQNSRRLFKYEFPKLYQWMCYVFVEMLNRIIQIDAQPSLRQQLRKSINGLLQLTDSPTTESRRRILPGLFKNLSKAYDTWSNDLMSLTSRNRALWARSCSLKSFTTSERIRTVSTRCFSISSRIEMYSKCFSSWLGYEKSSNRELRPEP